MADTTSAPPGGYRPIPGWPRDHMLEAAFGLLCNADPSAVLPDPQVWRDAVTDWIGQYHDLVHEHGPVAVAEPTGTT